MQSELNEIPSVIVKEIRFLIYKIILYMIRIK